MIDDKAYAIALWRLKKHRVPDRMDWLHCAVVEYLEQEPKLDEGRLGNWLGLVAWRKWKDHLKRWDVERFHNWDDWHFEAPEKEEKQQEERNELSKLLGERDRVIFRLWLEGKNIPQTAKGLGLSSSRVHQIRARIRELAHGLSGHRPQHGYRSR